MREVEERYNSRGEKVQVYPDESDLNLGAPAPPSKKEQKRKEYLRRQKKNRLIDQRRKRELSKTNKKNSRSRKN